MLVEVTVGITKASTTRRRWVVSALPGPVTGKAWATAPQFCGLKILQDGIHGGADLPGSVQAFDEVGGEAHGGL